MTGSFDISNLSQWKLFIKIYISELQMPVVVVLDFSAQSENIVPPF